MSNSSPIKGSHSQYVPSLFATNAQSMNSDGGVARAGGGSSTSPGRDERYAHLSFDEQQRGRGETYTTTTATAPGAAAGRPPAAPAAERAVASPSPVSTVDYAEIEQKQTELRSAVEYRIHSLEGMLAMRDEELVRLRAQLRKMEEDYQFNYNLIGERDAALEEAAQQLQRMYREMKRVTDEGGVMEKKLGAAEAEAGELRQRLRDAEAARESAVSQVKKEYAVKEQHLTQTMRAREAALEAERQAAHEGFMQQARELEATRAQVEGQTASVSTQLEERHRQVVQRLEDEVARMRAKMQAAEAAKTEAEGRIRHLEEEVRAQQQQSQVAAQRHETAMEEVGAANRRLEGQLAQTTTLLNKSLATAEDAIREETQKSSRLELENTALQTRLAEAKSQLQEALAKQADDAKSFGEERRALQGNYQSALAAMEETETKWRSGERSLQGSLAEKTEEAAQLSRRLQEAERGLRATAEAAEREKATAARLQEEVERLAAEVQRWKDEEAKTAAAARHEKGVWEEKHLAQERAAQEAKGELERQRRKTLDIQERSQAESARLTRELHASEAARRALEDQFHLAQDHGGQGALIRGLTYEKEVLERRIVELERTNGEIREQVANFTLELQNDPVVRSAKEGQRKLQEAQQELLGCRDEIQRLRDVIAEKEEELARYQVDILRAQMLLGSEGGAEAFAAMDIGGRGGGSAATLSSSAAAVLQRQQAQLREEWASMRARLEKEIRSQKEGKGRKRRGGDRHRSTSSSSTASSTSSEGGSSTSSLLERGRGGRARRHSRRHRKSSREPLGAASGFANPPAPAAAPAAAVPAPLPPSSVADDGKGARVSYLLQESEVWRQKSLQLEQHLHAVIKERDQLRRELAAAKQDVTALSSEKQSLLDLNSLLKAQLREAYRTSYDMGPAAAAGKTHPSPGEDNGGGGRSTAVSACPPPEWLAAAAAAMMEHHQQQQPPRPPRPPQPSASRTSHYSDDNFSNDHSGAPAHGANDRPSTTTPAGERRTVAGLNTSRFSSSGAASHSQSPPVATDRDAASYRQYQRQKQRLGELEEEIRVVRAQLSTDRAPAPLPPRRWLSSASTPAAAQGRSSKHRQERGSSAAPVIRKGGTAIRHYGYGDL